MGRQLDNMEKKPKESQSKNVRDSLLVLSLICLLLTTIVFSLEVNSFHKLKRELSEKASATTQVHIDWLEITTHPQKSQEDILASKGEPTSEAQSIDSKPPETTIYPQKTEAGTQDKVHSPIAPNASANIQTHDVIPPNTSASYVVNSNSKKIHKSDCRYVKQMKPENRKTVDAKDLQALLDNGYSYCSVCCKSE